MQSETLADTAWDVVIEGTGLPQSLLALALSRSGKKILHVDRNDYYGGNEASLGLTEAEEWAVKHVGAQSKDAAFSHAVLKKLEGTGEIKLGRPRAYELSLAPQLLYSRSFLLDAVVSSQIHNQLDFQAVGSWFVVDTATGGLVTVPGSREDIFRDDKINMKAKRALMKLLRSLNAEDADQVWAQEASMSFTTVLEQKFGLPTTLHAPILALAMTTEPPQSTTADFAVPRIMRHLRSIGMHAPGCPALLQRYGGLAEIIQVACRANAVGGGVYVLGTGITTVHSTDENKLSIALDNGEQISTRWLVTASSHEQAVPDNSAEKSRSEVSKSISVVASPLTALFQPLAAGAVTPAGAIVLIPGEAETDPPAYIFAHSSDSGECPSGQSVLYASIAAGHEYGYARLDLAVSTLLSALDAESSPEVLWCLQYQQDYAATSSTSQHSSQVVRLHPVPAGMVLEDSVLEDVKAAWLRIVDGEDSDSFMSFAAREGTTDDDDEDT
ncbi:Putative GDP dissociation inhibitor, FAD/NAD(P)-binding domain superfamily [Septoria linicola]|uniref:Rab proteins geranylgeranyltransferase n=1 Tax=Septoria linicola TaxID=215465 RepID=A0A9Q9AD46_9PEZI|nr:putative GDP dissociation inhibitor, FAD/NAD(P)-binding domain superfamily [Septoria linicola]USW46925.1 Putative GDP dissociation inhibitor, FAD/NAD(P)-binding domain superfamily [Septoria linicola]